MSGATGARDTSSRSTPALAARCRSVSSGSQRAPGIASTSGRGRRSSTRTSIDPHRDCSARYSRRTGCRRVPVLAGRHSRPSTDAGRPWPPRSLRCSAERGRAAARWPPSRLRRHHRARPAASSPGSCGPTTTEGCGSSWSNRPRRGACSPGRTSSRRWRSPTVPRRRCSVAVDRCTHSRRTRRVATVSSRTRTWRRRSSRTFGSRCRQRSTELGSGSSEMPACRSASTAGTWRSGGSRCRSRSGSGSRSSWWGWWRSSSCGASHGSESA